MVFRYPNPRRPLIAPKLNRSKASDREAGAIKMAHATAERTGVSDAIEFKFQAVSSITPPAGPGWALTNPPYGMRLSDGKDLHNQYVRVGNVLRRPCPGWNVAVLCNDPILLDQVQMKMDTSLGFVNGGIEIRVVRGRINHCTRSYCASALTWNIRLPLSSAMAARRMK